MAPSIQGLASKAGPTAPRKYSLPEIRELEGKALAKLSSGAIMDTSQPIRIFHPPVDGEGV
jgi:hypothetical protein